MGYMDNICVCGGDRPRGHICGRWSPGDAEPMQGQRLSCWVIQWERHPDGKWRAVGLPRGDYPEYTWDELVTGFGELDLVEPRRYHRADEFFAAIASVTP